MFSACIRCGQRFEPSRSDQRYCHNPCRNRHESRARTRAQHILEFVGVDGEGVTRTNGTHDYVLFSVGSESLHNPDGSRLEWEQIFTFLYEQFLKDTRAAYVGFFLGYDFTQWIRTLPVNRAAMLMSTEGIAIRRRTGSGGNPVPFPVRIDSPNSSWEFDLLGTKRFKLRPVGAKSWMYICDTGAFWQTSFLKAIDPAAWKANPVATDAEYAVIVEGKAARATAQFDTAMIRYNVVENAVLSRLMTRLNEGFSNVGLRLNKDQWFGPGQAAAVWLKSIAAPTGEAVRSAVPPSYLHAAQESYYGGWFEIHAHGHIPGPTYEYDINSAYPAVIASLPCLLHGTWDSGTELTHTGSYTLVNATMRGSNPQTGVMAHRLPSGGILRPHTSRGWIWGDELFTAVNAGLIDDFDVHEWHDYQPCPCPPPMASIAELYKQRLELGKNTPEGKALKLVYNSAYGKFAQSIGTPRYSNAIYASLITSGCRTHILNAIATHPTQAESLVMVATDGIYFREPHTQLDIDPQRLGAWDETIKHNMTLLMPGVYWSDTDRERIKIGQAPAFKSRGISASDLASRISDIDDQFHRFDGTSWPSLSLDVGFSMISCKQALQRRDWSLAGVLQSAVRRTISSAPQHKRMAHRVELTGDIWRTPPWPNTPNIQSTPYALSFGDTSDTDGLTPDAPDSVTALHWALQED